MLKNLVQSTQNCNTVSRQFIVTTTTTNYCITTTTMLALSWLAFTN